MYTTKDYEFLEQTYYYSQPGPQGKKVSDDLGWLIHPMVIDRDLKEKVGETIDVVTEDIVSPLPTTPVLSNEHPISQEVISQNQQVIDTNFPSIASNDVPSRYELPPRSTRRIPPRRYDLEFETQWSRYPVNRENNEALSQTVVAFNTSLYSSNVPNNVEEALRDPNWKKAMEEEISAFNKNETWEKCELPKGKKAVGSKWVYTIKFLADGIVERYKARLVAQRYTQTYGVDYSETFSSVAKIDTIRVLFSIAANKDWPLHQFDVKNAFLHGKIEEEVYMKAPPGFSSDYSPGEGCKLNKALYGLKQSPKEWFGRFTTAMKKFGYRQSNPDHTLFLKK